MPWFLTSVDGANKGVVALNGSDIRDLSNVQQGGSAGEDVLAKGRVGSNQMGESVLLLGLDEERGVRLGEGVGKGSILGNKNLGDASELGDLGNNRVGGATGNEGSDGTTQARGSSKGVQSRGSDLVVLVLDQQQSRDISAGGVTADLRLSLERLEKKRRGCL